MCLLLYDILYVISEFIQINKSLIINHLFIDNNKWAAYFMTDVFPCLNGWKLLVEAEPGHAFITDRLEENLWDYDHLVEWIR